MNLDQSKYLQYLNSYNDYNNLVVENTQETADEEEYQSVCSKIEKFVNLHAISEAKTLAREIFGIKNEVNYIKAGKAQCTIISRANLFRIVLDSEKEFKCINIINKREDK